jgi:hypothetical protein
MAQLIEEAAREEAPAVLRDDAATRRLPIMPEFPSRHCQSAPMHSVDPVRTVFHHSQGAIRLRMG